MKRVLVLYYTQSGDVRRMAEAFTEPLKSADVEIVWTEIQSAEPFPYPWRNPHRFFNVMPECVLGLPPEIETPDFDPEESFDLIVLAYQVWFLSPSPPIQSFFRSDHARVLRGRKVITISVSRDMWHRASFKMKQLLAEAGAVHIDNVVVTHQGPRWATFITTPRSLITGKKDPLWGVLPPAGITEAEDRRVSELGAAVARQLDVLEDPAQRALLRGMNAVEVNRRYVIPEWIASRFFPMWAHVIRGFGRLGAAWRHVGIFLFIHFLLFMILAGIPMTIITLPLVYPFIRKPMAAYVSRLKQPTES
jgi:hypothetical protein